MDKDVLPSQEFFIYVPSMRDIVLSADAMDTEKRIKHMPSEKCESNTHGLPADVQSWTKIELADAVSVYACL